MRKEFNPEMLILAREVRGITQKQLAELSGIDQGSVSRYEGGIKSISDHDLKLISEALHFPTGFFFRRGERRGPETGELFHRKLRSVTAKEQTPIDARLNMLRLDAETYLEVADIESPFKIPSYTPSDFDGDIDAIAASVRAAWNISSGPIRSVVQTLEDAFCIIQVWDFGIDQSDETVQWVEPMTPVMLVNKRSSGDRLRYSMTHALGHLVMHHNKPPYEEMEDEANQFAAAFLMPAEDIASELEPVTIEHLLQLKPAWKVSVQALIRRAKDLGVINERRYTSLFQMLSRMGYRKKEPFPIPVEKPTLLPKLMDLYRKELNYSISELAEVIHIHENDLERWYLPNSFSETDLRIVPKSKPHAS